ncbi:hypothetical protein V8E51_010498 [Hyaloscypha variabilis]
MDQVIFRESGCVLCVLRGHVCDRAPNRSCRECRSNIIYQINAARDEVHKRRRPGSLISLDTRGINTNDLHVYVKSSTEQRFDFYPPITIAGEFNTQNPGVREPFDSHVRHLFSANLRPSEAEFSIIETAMTACGYLAMLCSVTEVMETSYTSENGIMVQNTWQHSNLEALFGDFCVCRLRELIEQVMDAARTVVTNENQQYCSNAYTASALLYYELKYFKASLKHGHLRTLIPKVVKRLLVKWFASLIDELVQRLREGCARYPYWRYAVKGPLDSLRRHEETYKVHLWLQRNQWTAGPSLLLAPNPAPPPPLELAPGTSVAIFHAATAMTPNIIVEANGEMSYVDSSPRYYNPATGQAGPTTSSLDTRYDSYYGHYSGQYPF